MDLKEYVHQVEQALHYIREQVDFVPAAALVLGSGLGSLADAVEAPIVIPYEDIPHWKSSTAPGHAGRLVCGKLGGLPVVVMKLSGHDNPEDVLKVEGIKVLTQGELSSL